MTNLFKENKLIFRGGPSREPSRTETLHKHPKLPESKVKSADHKFLSIIKTTARLPESYLNRQLNGPVVKRAIIAAVTKTLNTEENKVLYPGEAMQNKIKKVAIYLYNKIKNRSFSVRNKENTLEQAQVNIKNNAQKVAGYKSMSANKDLTVSTDQYGPYRTIISSMNGKVPVENLTLVIKNAKKIQETALNTAIAQTNQSQIREAIATDMLEALNKA